MKVGIIGLGRMGNAIAYRLINAGHDVIGFDLNMHARAELVAMGGTAVDSLEHIAAAARIFWLMVPVAAVDTVIHELKKYSKAGDIFIDGGNSYFEDSIRRAHELAQHKIFFLDCGTSGGVYGRTQGFCLMVGGDETMYTKVYELLAAIAAPGGVARVGSSGTGHYVKMVHNGIEYGLMQAYAEGMQLIKDGCFKSEQLDLEEITRIWNTSSIIRSFILELMHNIFTQDQDLNSIRGKVDSTGMGKWTVQEAHKAKVPVPVIEEALHVREWSQQTGGNYATKLVALLRQQFGGHPIHTIGEEHENS
ncbi:MAG TPA: decarboxylating 6-phosphogluconate dehydrogenase [Candidatus Dependentiae bacterium]|nr:decarboxylating 6-phosphogluconate dehydrogenase [Candidatus Dependentiae bacterium]HRQ62820.1 decarboxylating 6-phosphogluconate dehydrogenase [Candidatus Dependentiae bacterium]